MIRQQLTPRNNWKKEVEKLGFGFHTSNIPYWDESACYQFDMKQINSIENATNDLWDMCLVAVQHVIDNNLYSKFNIPSWIVPYIEKTWNEDYPSIYGRFDLVFKDNQIKMLEFNADTPTSLFEASIVQWYWLKDYDESKDQFNSIHEKLVDYWSYLKEFLYKSPLYFTCVKNSLEDLTTTEYLRDCAIQAELDTKFIYIDDIGYNGKFVDSLENEIKNIFKLYPYEFMFEESFGKCLDKTDTFWIEPSWKSILSNKALMPILWDLYPNHPLLLPSYFEKNELKDYVIKPIHSREGANIKIVKNDIITEKTTGIYNGEVIYQQLFELPNYNDNYPVIGSWIIGQESAGIGIRESNSLITNNKSRFIPHLIY